ncbi:MAG: hypothetical protein HOP09_03130 [Hyphomicrobium sp.]|nr:hypothetical protein [Hyphomicrobium sp.]
MACMPFGVGAGLTAVLALAAMSASALADEAYLCGPDRIVYVSVADLEMKKRTDPCIAAYYGLKIEEPAKQEAAAPAPVAAKPAPPTPAPALIAELKPLSDAEVAPRVIGRPGRQASLETPRAMPGTDYRNVKILNAATPDAAWFHHVR